MPNKDKRGKTKSLRIVGAIVALAVVLSIAPVTTTLPIETEIIETREPIVHGIHYREEYFQYLNTHIQIEADDANIANTLENNIFNEGVYGSLIDEDDEKEIEPILTHETSSIAPEGFDTHSVIYHTFSTGVPGPNVVIIGGVHGSERSGMLAAQYIVDNFSFETGNFLIIPKATANAPEAWGPGGRNLNRQFPGNADGNVAQKVAAIITKLIDDFHPCLIIDMHEANGDGFSNKILYWPNHKTTTLQLEAIEFVANAINQTDLVGRHLGTYGGRNFGPAKSKTVAGTTTREFTLRYNVPAFTIETCMTNRLDVRVEQQVFIITYLYEFFQMKHDRHLRELEKIFITGYGLRE